MIQKTVTTDFGIDATIFDWNGVGEITPDGAALVVRMDGYPDQKTAMQSPPSAPIMSALVTVPFADLGLDVNAIKAAIDAGVLKQQSVLSGGTIV